MSSAKRRQWQREVVEAERQRRADQFRQRIKGKSPVLPPGVHIEFTTEPLSKPAPAEPPPVFSQCVVGYRMWYVDPFMRLRPVSVDRGPWLPGVNVATCHAAAAPFYSTGTHPVGESCPAHDCHCGFYAYNNTGYITSEVFSTYRGVDIFEVVRPVLVGAVAGWGTMEVHRDGWRAEKACVTALATTPSMPDDVVALTRAVADRYEVPVVPADVLQLEGERHAVPLTQDVIPAGPDDPFAAVAASMSKLQRQLFQGLSRPSANAGTWLPKS